MMIFDSAAISKVNIADITDNELFKVSKNIFQVTLPASLKLSGMLEVPYIFKKDKGYNILTCHNRIKILREAGITHLECFVLDHPDAAIFMNHVSLKTYRNELGSFGKLKTLSLLSSAFNLNESERKEFCTKVLKLASEFIDNEAYLKKIMDFPDTLISYIDEKDISFKIIKDLSLLPAEWIAVVSRWINDIQIRVNIFRMLIDYLFDIYRRGDSISVIEAVISGDDKTLYDNIYRIRYPEYSKLKMKSDSIINELSGAGLTIEFPEYFDRRSLTLKIDIDKKTDCANQLKKVSKIDIDKLTELLSLL